VAELPVNQEAWVTRFLHGLLVVQIIVGFEFFWTVLAKLVRGGFVSGLAADLKDRVKAAPSWYASFANHIVVPHATLFGVLIIVGEMFVGVTMIVAAAVWLRRWQQISLRGRYTLVTLIMLAAVSGLAMNVNYHIANGALNPWQIGTSVFDEGVDINTVLPLIELTIIGVMASVFIFLRRGRENTRHQ